MGWRKAADGKNQQKQTLVIDQQTTTIVSIHVYRKLTIFLLNNCKKQECFSVEGIPSA